VLSAGVLPKGWFLALTKKVICMQLRIAAWTQVSLQSIIMDIGPSRDRSEPGSPASMSVDSPSAPPAFNPAAFLGAGSYVSSTEHAGQAPQVIALPMQYADDLCLACSVLASSAHALHGQLCQRVCW
jgi:hypothetical protein